LVATNSFNSDAVAKITGSSLLWGSPVVVGAFYKLIQCLAYKTMLLGDSSFDTTLWTISLELYGSFFVFAFLGLTHNTKNRFSILVFLLLFTIVNDIIFLASFVFGIGLNFVEQHGSLKNKNLTNAFAIVLFITSLGFGSFPSTGMVRGTFYAKLSDWPTVFPWFHPVGAFLLVLSCVLSPVLQRMFSIRFFRFLGYVSFSLYLLHPLIIYAVGCPLFLNLYGSLDYNKTVGVVFLCCASVSLLVSWVMAKYVDAAGVKAAKYIYERWIKRKQGIELTE
jgi:peptidoglycan/LPS O-acetylase OafA/YrhL